MTPINGRWPLNLAPHRIEQWSKPWEAKRLSRMYAAIDDWPHRPVVWDIGAEEGDMPALYASWGADVVIVEPNPKLWPSIRYHWQANDLPDPVGFYVGLAGSPEQIHTPEAEAHTDGWPAASLGEIHPGHGFHHLQDYATTDPVATLDQMLDWFPAPDIITADIEGGEGLMLQGAKVMLADVRPTWFLSVHSSELRELYGHTPSEHVHEVMGSHGYTAEFIEDRHEGHWVYFP